ncbi:MAG: saccharopine dehydrogenase C-terminal domain-containing protein [bacterium]|nr:saccharopine dehydrogenase C-terminal domain-containing protein [bacterium]
MKKVAVLGVGLVGKAIALDMKRRCYDVVAIDKDKSALTGVADCAATIEADLSNAEIVRNNIADVDLVILAVPGFMGYETLKTIIQAGKNVVDISFFKEDCRLLNGLAKQKGVIAVTDCGVAPGMSNIILGYHNAKAEIESFECLVGGLPTTRYWPFQYKAPFSPIDVIEEYLRPARYIKDGKLIEAPAMSDAEFIDFDKIGTLEAFLTDGLRSLLAMKIPNMRERTLRYPGHIGLIKIFKTLGFFGENAITIGNKKVRPIDVTSRLLLNDWKSSPSEDEFTVMRIVIVERTGREIIYNLFDRYDSETGLSSMARTTGFVATAVANLILSGKFKSAGISPPEKVGAYQDCFKIIMNDLKERGVIYQVSETPHK